MIKAVVFDLGKVLLDFDYGIAARKIAERASMPANEIQRLIDGSPLLLRYESAQMNAREFYDEVRAHTKFRGSFEDFAATFADIFFEIPPMVRLHAALRERGIPTFILSNTNDIAIGHIRRNFPFFANFSGYVFSYEHAVLKPEAGIYEVAERLAGGRAEELVFIDDRLENVEGAARLGWNTIWHRDPQATTAALRSLMGT